MRRSALASLDPSRTINSAEAVTADTRKYLALLKGFRGKSTEPPTAGSPPADGLPPAYVDVAGGGGETGDMPPPPYPGSGDEKTPEPEPPSVAPKPKPKKDWFGRVIEEPTSIEGSDDNAPVPALPLGGAAVSLVDQSSSSGPAADVDALVADDTSTKDQKEKKKKKQMEATTPAVKDGTLRHMMAFVWRDLGDNQGYSFSMADTMLEEASVLFALAQILLQKAKAEPLNDTSMLDVFKWLKQSSGVLAHALEVVKLAKAPEDHKSDDMKNGLLTVLVDVSLAQAQHVTIRRAMITMGSNKAISYTLIAKLCNDTAERYKAMEPAARGLCDGQKKEGVGAYVMAHLRYKQLYFMGLAYAMVGLDRITSAPENLGYGIRDLHTAKDLWTKAEMAGKVFIEAARSIVFVDNLSILQQLNDCQQVADDAIQRAQKENDTVYFKVSHSILYIIILFPCFTRPSSIRLTIPIYTYMPFIYFLNIIDYS